MNWPNRLTLVRIALIPLLIVLMQFENTACRLLALLVFLAAAATDWLDGWMARKYHIVTNFGKFLDPVADKLLVLSTMIALAGLGRFPAWACIVVLFRELSVDGLRLVAAEQGRVIAAGKLGKIKTTVQMITLIVYLCENWLIGVYPMDQVLLWITVGMTLWSGVDYFLRNRDVLKEGGKA
ncbi:MAG: CDP-diacylglycerol--glycerol-3-phosphate 3-phosphatidyltransferase [Eubacteriales bacterium]|nr:CDP-diacylglycerol--glycerol-3-phosphate 3-phosphatidyltransferase [Eubacteriales bacterium]